MIDVLMVFIGLFLLVMGGESLVKGSVALANNFGLSKLLVSIVIIGFGTSMPEMTVSISAALKGSSDIALGNVVGSNIANILLILGSVAIFAPITISATVIRRDAIVMMASSLVLCGLSLASVITFVAGLGMISALLIYIVWACLEDRKNQSKNSNECLQEAVVTEKNFTITQASLLSSLGLALLVIGSYVMVEGAISIARTFEVSEAVIGLTIVAVGTSLPEFIASIIAVIRKQADFVVGNILGSNIFNIFAILGTTSMISPISMEGQIANIDIWIMLGVSLFLFTYLVRGQLIGRFSGMFMVAAYLGYTTWLYSIA